MEISALLENKKKSLGTLIRWDVLKIVLLLLIYLGQVAELKRWPNRTPTLLKISNCLEGDFRTFPFQD